MITAKGGLIPKEEMRTQRVSLLATEAKEVKGLFNLAKCVLNKSSSLKKALGAFA